MNIQTGFGCEFMMASANRILCGGNGAWAKSFRGWAMRVPELLAEASYVNAQKPQIPLTQIKCY